MNKIRTWFYEKAKKNMLNEAEEYGLSIVDEEKFHKRISDASRKDMIYTFVMILLIIWIVVRWVT